tara:strand:+ start:266 stop:856 length:591 start_codon:yes stop_codon:yes gene_type:complete
MSQLQQKKLMAVASELGLSTLDQMQGSTGAVYDEITLAAGVTNFSFFRNAGSHPFPASNLSSNRFEANEALLIEALAVYTRPTAGTTGPSAITEGAVADETPIIGVLDLQIGNKRVLKDLMVSGNCIGQAGTAKNGGDMNNVVYLAPTVGIVIPPQVEFEATVRFSRDPIATDPTDFAVGLYLYGTKVNLTFNTSL